MRFLSSRELRNNPGSVWDALTQDEIVLTANGKPVAIMLGVEENEVEETLDLIRQVRAQRAISRMQRAAREQGLDRMSPEEIEEEIRRARAERKQTA